MPDTLTPPPPLTEAGILAWLTEHPDFLVKHGETIRVLSQPAERDGRQVVDFQQHLVSRLRAELAEAKDVQRDLLSATRGNLAVLGRIHGAVIFLLDAGGLQQLIQTITTDLAVMLDVDVATLVMETGAADAAGLGAGGVRMVESGRIASTMQRKEIRLQRQVEGDTALFGPAAELVKSHALVRLTISSASPPGLLCFGSRDPDHFHDGQATEWLSFLGRVVERCLRRALGTAEA